MKISFGSIEHLREECIARDIHEVRRDYMVETKPAETGNKHIGAIALTHFKMIVTATDGKDILRLEHPIYRCFQVEVNEEKTKKDVEARIDMAEAQLQKDFPEEYRDEEKGVLVHKFVLKRGVIEEV